jgi:hypothetical protein
MVYITMLFSSSDCTAPNDMMNNELEGIWKEAVVA